MMPPYGNMPQMIPNMQQMQQSLGKQMPTFQNTAGFGQG
jgi:hypothetical protein